MSDAFHKNDLEELLKIKTEGKNLDYKQGLNWDTCEKDAKIEIVKDILAMANVQDGGRIVFGVRDADLELLGLSDEEFKSFDQTKVNDFLQKYTDPKFACQVYKHNLHDKLVVVIDVPEFTEVPILCKLNANSSKDPSKLLLREGQMYIRTAKGSSEAISSAQEMREVLGRALTKTGDKLLANIERLIKGRPPKTSEESLDKYREEINDAKSYFEKSIGGELTKYGSWKVCVYPSGYSPKRISDQKAIKDLIDKSEVNLRGWNFPHTDAHGNAANFLKGRQSYTMWDRYSEAYRAYESGLFIWSRVFWEDKEERKSEGKPVLDFISAIWSLTEFLLFVKRYYEAIIADGDLHLEITLHETEERRLVALAPLVHIWGDHISRENVITLQEDMQVVTVRASYKEIANRLARQLFAIFNWDDASENMIEGWQMKLLERKF
jgi:hypothetical protein